MPKTVIEDTADSPLSSHRTPKQQLLAASNYGGHRSHINLMTVQRRKGTNLA